MRQILSILLIAAALTTMAALWGGWWWLLLYPALSFAVLAAGYLKFGPKIFGKSSQGKIALRGWVVLLPYQCINLVLWNVSIRALAGENPCDEVAPGIWVGRWPSHGVVPAEVEWVVDLTAEFPVRGGIRAARKYTALPTLDAWCADDAAFMALAEEIAQSSKKVLIHCASGHGRSATLAAMVVIMRKQASSVEEAVSRMKKARRLITLNAVQQAQVRRMIALISARTSPPSPAESGSN